jgi:hypothetical protein
MNNSRYTLTALFLFISLAALLLLPINRNTARQIWYMFDVKNAPKGCTLIIGGRAHNMPYYYGDTWFSRFHQFATWINSPRLARSPSSGGIPMIVSERIIIAEEEELILLNGRLSSEASSEKGPPKP